MSRVSPLCRILADKTHLFLRLFLFLFVCIHWTLALSNARSSVVCGSVRLLLSHLVPGSYKSLLLPNLYEAPYIQTCQVFDSNIFYQYQLESQVVVSGGFSWQQPNFTLMNVSKVSAWMINDYFGFQHWLSFTIATHQSQEFLHELFDIDLFSVKLYIFGVIQFLNSLAPCKFQ